MPPLPTCSPDGGTATKRGDEADRAEDDEARSSLPWRRTTRSVAEGDEVDVDEADGGNDGDEALTRNFGSLPASICS